MIRQERRTRLRFPLDAELRFHVLRRGQGRPVNGVGRVMNMSSKGLAFRTETALTDGARLSGSISWPALLDQKCRLRLFVEGTLLRVDGDVAVLRIESHDFRTSGSGNGSGNAEFTSLLRGIEGMLTADAS